MRKSIQLLFVLSILFLYCGTLLAQDASMFGLAPNMWSGEKGQPQYQGIPTDANTGYGNDAIAAGTPWISMPIPAGTPFTTINPSFTPGWCAGGDIGANGVYYGCTYIAQGQSNLVSVNVGTGVPTIVGPITGITLYPTCLDYNAATNTWYYGDTDGATSRLYTINIGTGAATLVGQMTGVAGLIGMAIDCNGLAYALDIVTDQLYSVNLSTGAGTIIGPVGFDASYAQDMDFDGATGTLYLAAYNAGVGQGELRSANLTTGNTTLITAWPGSEVTGFAIDNPCGPPCPIGAPSNPNPPSGTTGLPLTGNTLSWTNGSGTVNVEVWFGAGTLTKVYDGAAITSYALPTLLYGTNYSWYIICKDATCGTYGPTWTFSTMQDPNLWTGTVDIYPQNANYWTGTCSPSAKTQVSLVNAAATDVGWMVFDVTPIVNHPTTTILEIEFNGYLTANNWPYWSITPMGSVNPVTDPASTINSQVSNAYQQGTAYSFNQESGTIPAPAWLERIFESNANTDLKNVLGQGWFAIGIVDWDFTSTYFVNFDGWQETNRPYLSVTYSYVTPVELTSFTANANFGVVELQWITATETNNQGFEVQRSAGGEFETIAFVEGHGTTTETQVYTYQDNTIGVGSYSYRLKQIDFDGSFEYSDVIDADVPAPAEFALDQNYPNPFNPSTQIAFRLAVDSKVSLKVFDVLGQEVATLVNTNMVVGEHTINFNASSLNSGVYLYRIEATGVDGSNFVDIKKMILTK